MPFSDGGIEIRLLVTEQPFLFLQFLGIQSHLDTEPSALPDPVQTSGALTARSPARTRMRMGFKLYDDIVLRHVEVGALVQAWGLRPS